MQKIKNWNQFQKANESVLSDVITFFADNMKPFLFAGFKLSIYIRWFWKLYIKDRKESFGELDQKMIDKIEKITGRRFVIRYIESSEHYAYARANEIYYTGLLKNMLTEEEIIAVLLHETGHIVNKHNQKTLISKILIEFPFLFSFFQSWALYGLSKLVDKLYFEGFCRRQDEFIADSEAKRWGYGGQLATALAKIADPISLAKTKTILGKFNDLLKQHPKTNERIKRLLSKATTLEEVNRLIINEHAIIEKMVNQIWPVFMQTTKLKPEWEEFSEQEIKKRMIEDLSDTAEFTTESGEFEIRFEEEVLLKYFDAPSSVKIKVR